MSVNVGFGIQLRKIQAFFLVKSVKFPCKIVSSAFESRSKRRLRQPSNGWEGSADRRGPVRPTARRDYISNYALPRLELEGLPLSSFIFRKIRGGLLLSSLNLYVGVLERLPPPSPRAATLTASHLSKGDYSHL